MNPDTAKTLQPDLDAPYGRGPGGVPYTQEQYAERFHRSGIDPIAWPPNDGAVAGTKLDYDDATKFVRDFGNKVDRLGDPKGVFFGLMEKGIHAAYEARALHYGSLYKKLHTYTLMPEKLPKDWKIRVMETAPAFGQPGGSVSLMFFNEKGKELSAEQLTDPRIGVLRDER